MLKPRKNKKPVQAVTRGHQIVFYAAHGGHYAPTAKETNDLAVLGVEAYSVRFAEAPYVSRAIIIIARNRFVKSTVGVVGLKPMDKDRWEAYWTLRNLKKTARESQVRQLLYRGDQIDRVTRSPYLYAEPLPPTARLIDRFIEIDAGVMEPGINNPLTTQIVKGRKPGMSTLFQNGIGNSPRIGPTLRKSDIEMNIAMLAGVDAVRELYLKRYGVTGPDGKRYLLDTEYYDAERAEALLKMVLDSESAKEVSVADVREFRKGLNNAKVGAFGDTPWRPTVKGIEGFVTPEELHKLQGTKPEGRSPLTMAREYAMTGSWGTPEDISGGEAFKGEVKGVELRRSSGELNNPELNDIDPFSEELTDEQKAAILEEAKINPLYFYRIVLRAQSSAWTDARFPFTNEEVNQIVKLQSLAKEHEYRPQEIDTAKKHYFQDFPPDDLWAGLKPKDE